MTELPEGLSVLRIAPDVFEYCYLTGDDRRTLHDSIGKYIVAEMTARGNMFCMDTISASQAEAISLFLANYKES